MQAYMRLGNKSFLVLFFKKELLSFRFLRCRESLSRRVGIMRELTPGTRPKLSGEALAAARRANGRKGGRPPGAKNNATIRRERFAKDGLDDALACGMSPLGIMILGMREPGKVSRTRLKRAAAAAP